MSARDPGPDVRTGEWAYVSLLGGLPGVSLGPRVALALQFLAFEGAAVALAAWYGRWAVLPAGTVAIGVATLGSGLMVALTERVRRPPSPRVYRAWLFGSAVDVVMGVLAFVALLTYLLVTTIEPGTGTASFPAVVPTAIRAAMPGAGGATAAPLTQLLGPSPPAPIVFLGLLVAWDLCYRIGTGWWASVVGLWRSIALRDRLSPATRRRFSVVDGLTVAFAGLQLAILPFLGEARLLSWLLLGHVAAVLLVSGASVAVLRWG